MALGLSLVVQILNTTFCLLHQYFLMLPSAGNVKRKIVRYAAPPATAHRCRQISQPTRLPGQFHHQSDMPKKKFRNRTFIPKSSLPPTSPPSVDRVSVSRPVLLVASHCTRVLWREARLVAAGAALGYRYPAWCAGQEARSGLLASARPQLLLGCHS